MTYPSPVKTKGALCTLRWLGIVGCSHWFGDNELVEQLSGSMGDAHGVGEECLDGSGGFDRVIVEPRCANPFELRVALGQLADSAIVDQTQPALDRPEEIVGIA